MMICSYENAEAFSAEYEEMEAMMEELMEDNEFMAEFEKSLFGDNPSEE